jgi:di/tricarboxylate transporter
VVAPAGDLAGDSIRGANFRTRFHGVVIAVGRNGERVQGRLGDVRLRGGDLLLVEADRGFDERARAVRDFLLVRSLADSTPRLHHKAPLAIAILLAMVVSAAFGIYPMVVAAAGAAMVMIATGCCSLADARRAVDVPVLVVIGCSLGIGAAMERSGAAGWIASTLLGVVGTEPWLALAGVYAVTTLLTEIISNSAAVALTFPIALSLASSLGVDTTPFVIAITMAGSASFATPIGYQTNLMVYGPGGYTFGDFLRAGIPLNLLAGVVTVTLTPLVFPFHAG